MSDALDAQARRLIATREALGYRVQLDFCKAIGVEKNVYNPFEKGKRPISLAVARRIKRRFNIGDPQDLPGHLFPTLENLAA